MDEKIRTRIRLNRKEPEFINTKPFLQKKHKFKSPESPERTGMDTCDQILQLHKTLGNQEVQRLIQSRTIHTKLRIGKPNDIYEQEADYTADQVMGMDTGHRRQASWSFTPVVRRQTIPKEEEKPTPEEKMEEKEPAAEMEPEENQEKEEDIQTKPAAGRREDEGEEEKGEESVPTQIESRLFSSRGSGFPLPAETRSHMEAGFGADFSDVRVHTDPSAQQMNRQLHSRAFTHGNHIYFAAGDYNPQTPEGKHLLAHELTHVLQQGAAVRRRMVVRQSSPEVIQRTSDSWGSLSGLLSNITSIIRGGISAGKRFFRDNLRRIPGYSLLGVVMGQDPLTGEGIARTGRNFIEAGLDVIPFGHDFKRKLEREGALDEAAAWLDGQIQQLDFSPSDIADQFRRFWDSLGLSDVFDLGGVIRRLRNIFEPPIARLFRFAENVARRLLEIVKNYLIQQVIAFIRNRTRAYPLLTVILGRDPISEEEVERTPMNLIRGFMELSEDGAEQMRQMEESGSLERAANWVSSSIARLTRNLQNIRDGFTRIWNNVSISSLMDPVGTFTEIYNTFAGPVGDILSFLVEVAVTVLRYIKDALLSRLSAYARTVRGYPLLTVILGRDPFSGETVPRTATNFVRGFLSLLEDGEERFRNLQQSGALDRAFAWLENEVRRLNLTWSEMVELFRTTWEELSLRDLASPVAAFQRIVNRFREPVGRIIRFAAAVGMKILEFVFEGVMGAGGARVLNILKRGRDTFMTIINDPIAFLGHLIDAVKQGLRQFARNILQHLQAGLVGWLFGALEGAGLQMPERFDLRGIISLVLQILGLTYTRIRPRLVRLLGERTVSALESTFEFLRLLVTEGPAAAWQKIVEFAGNLRDQVMDGIKNFVITRIVQAAVIRIASMFNPAGAVVQSIIAIYNTVMFFIERINQILAWVESVINSISNIAAGNIAAAANYVEQTMARTLPIIISFLARLMGLGNISGAIRRIIQRIRRPIDRAIDRIVDWIVRQARRLRQRFSGRRDDTAGGEDTEQSRAVKERVRNDLSNQDLSNFTRTTTIVRRTFERYRPEGLRFLKVVSDRSDPTRFVVKASASLEEEVKSFSNTRVSDKLRTIAMQMNPFAQKTTLYVFYDGRKPYGRGRSYSDITQGSPFENRSGRHAEENFLRQSGLGGSSGTPRIVHFVRQRRERQSNDANVINAIIPLTLDINRTPCGSTQHNCASHLSAAAANYSNFIRMTINAVSVYSRRLTYNTIALTTAEDINRMIEAGIEVNPLKIWDTIMQKFRSAGIEELEIAGKTFEVRKDWAAFSAEEQGVANLIVEAGTLANQEKTAMDSSSND
jgi:hypothetical protein